MIWLCRSSNTSRKTNWSHGLKNPLLTHQRQVNMAKHLKSMTAVRPPRKKLRKDGTSTPSTITFVRWFPCTGQSQMKEIRSTYKFPF